MLRFTSAIFAIAFLGGCVGSSTDYVRNGAVPGTYPPLVAGDNGPHCPRYPKGSGILTDGDFHQAVDPGAYYRTYSKGRRLALGWTVTVLDVNFVGTMFWNFHHLCSVDLDGQSAVGAIAHNAFLTKKGASYTLSFLMSGNSYCASTTKKMKVSAGSQTAIFKWNTANGHSVQYGIVARRDMRFTAASSTTTLKFISLDPVGSGCGPVVGAVSVTKS